MDNYQREFIMLYSLSSCDGEISTPELDLILSYLHKNREEINFDHQKIAAKMIFMNKEEIKKKVEETALEYKADSTDEDRKKLLRFGLDLVMSDGRIAAEEIRIFNILGKVWDIDIDQFIKDCRI